MPLQQLGGELGGEFFDGVGLVAVGDEEGVFGLDDDEVVDAEEGDVGAGAGVEDDVVFRLDVGDGAVDLVVFAGGLEVFGDGDPGADVIPIEGGLDVEDAAGFFHEGVVDGNGGEFGELGGDGGGGVGGAAEVGDEAGEFGGVFGEFADDGGEGPDEHAGVPAEAALGEELFGEVGAGFFAEAFHFGGGVFAVEAGDGGAGAALDVAVGGAGPGGFDADGDEAVRTAGGGEGVVHDRVVGGGVLDELVGGQDHHGGIRIAGGDEADAEGDGGGGIAFGGLGENVSGGQHGGDLADGIDLFVVGEDEDVFEGDEAFEAFDRLLEERIGAEEVEELLRFRIAAEGPEAGAGTAGENECVGGVHDERGWGVVSGGTLTDLCGNGMADFGKYREREEKCGIPSRFRRERVFAEAGHG
ncbi:MAG: hypothetical protein RLZ97_2313, partial [Verrucomicrobiota bacterium]